MANKPTNPELYARVKSEAKSKFDVWPSAYASSWLVDTYKKRGGGYRKAKDGMEVQGSVNEFVNDMRMMPMGGGIMYEDYNFPMMNGGMMENRIKRLENREANLVARGNKAVDEGRERKADRLLGRAARVENRLIKAKESVPVKNMIDIGNVEWAPNPLFYNPMMNGGEYGYMTYNPENQAPELPEMEQMREGGIPSRYKNMGFNKVGVKKQSTRPGKKWMVLAKKDDKYKVVHGGYKGMSDFTRHRNENRRERFWNRMGGRNSAKAKDPFSPLYWHKRFGTWAEGGEPQNEGFQALPEAVQAKIMVNMMYGGYLPEAAAGAAIMPIIKAVAPAVIGAMSKNKQASASAPAQAPINIYNVSPQQSETFQNPYNMKRPGEDVYAYAMGGVPCYECGGQMKYKKGGIPFTAMAYFGDGGMPYYQGGGSGMGQMALDEFEFNQMIQTPENNQETPSDFDDMFRRDISYLPNMKAIDMDDEKVNYIPGRSKNMYATKNFVAGLKGPKGGFNPFIAGNDGDESFRIQASDFLKPGMIGRGLVNAAGWLGRGRKESQAQYDINNRFLTDNLYEAVPMGISGERGNFDAFGNFRPDETLASRTYYNQMGGEIEMTDDQIRQLVALGAEIEILD
jgi:hypothetical protein